MDETEEEKMIYEAYKDDSREAAQVIPEADNFANEGYKKFISMWVMTPSGDMMAKVTVKGQKWVADGNLIGQSHPNPIL